MNDEHAQVLAELRALAEGVLERLEPVLQRAASAPSAPAKDGEGPSEDGPRSTCTWCPVCALVAMIRGEQHELLTLLAGQAAAVIAVLRQLLEERRDGAGPGVGNTGFSGSPAPDSESAVPDTTRGAVPTASAFVPISVTIRR